ncbi:CaiB/BaiF CoA transferase family protein [Sandarakinorhabdus limnophila]|uniref:CaiB/BaiF CoA transferase family protein n=2 Tax=Sandarakinorhabdus limnophila TaxID=210512 RepID=UPI0034C674F0
MTEMTAPAALAGIRVLDLSRVLAGPWSTQILADLGADVVKVEVPGRGDDTRAWGPPFLKGADGEDEIGTSAYYLAANRNKRSIAVDFADPAGAALLRELAMKADIVIENFKVGGLKKYGLDWESLRAVKPGLVYCSVTGFGQTGPYASRGGYDFVAQGMGGFMAITGEEGGQPLRAGVAMADVTTGLYATISILAALRHAERTGEGQQIDISLLDTQIACLANQAMNWLVGGVDPGRLGNRHPTVVPYKTFDVADGTIIIAIGNDGQFRAFCTLMGVPQLAQDERFGTARARLINRDAIEAEVQRLVANEPGLPLIDRLAAAGVPAGPVNKVSEVFADPFITARNVVHDFVRADGAHIPSVAFPGKLSATPATMRRPPPRVGEDEQSILADWLDSQPSFYAKRRQLHP